MVKTGNKQKQSKHKKKRLIVIISALVILILVAGYFIVIKNQLLTPVSERKLTVKEQRANNLRQALVTGDSKDSDKYFDESVTAAKDDQTKAAIYSERSAYTFYRDGVTKAQKESALADALRAYKLHNGPAEASLIVDIATSLKRQSVVKTYTSILNDYLDKTVKKPGSDE